jgi:hypothetical protein
MLSPPRSLDTATISIMGDLHLAPEQMRLFHQARDQLVKAMSENGKLIPGGLQPQSHHPSQPLPCPK